MIVGDDPDTASSVRAGGLPDPGEIGAEIGACAVIARNELRMSEEHPT